ncbi:CDP-glycerol glycerophosphotransferase (TagB/SpsB family)/GT2 family glycosyltransferase [Erwinia toletana]|uniref:CDP-glycerol glycerophosphotransferase (TagB/SpsB family)/GT2 family glycosyltransferase n=1 Tax=Winslowiella toletana TaxID=92490 RepID=A0ABS4P3A4_9GAMM|nr:glycosyltransferase [Winslowiella toletana]MBP2167136.1 CDP-glycerol glycerophosphotransferase (TagB/SpsB family)/GT2 family glycosyltransferase [Winslowiella toletana]
MIVSEKKINDANSGNEKCAMGMKKFDFSLLSVEKNNYIEFDGGYGDLALDAAACFNQVVVLDSRLPSINHISSQASHSSLDNITLHNQAILDYETEQKYDCVVFSDGLRGFSDDTVRLRVLLRATTFMNDNALLILAGRDDELETWQSFAGLMGFQYEGCQLISPAENAAIFRLTRPKAFDGVNHTLKVACHGSMPFHFRSLKPLAAMFSDSIVTLSIDEIMAYKPDVIAVADGWGAEYWRDYCDTYNVQLIGMRHGSVTRYGFAESQYNYADYLCGSPWDIEDTLQSSVLPRKGFLITGNSWVDQVFQIGKKEVDHNNLTILFAPTYNPEISAAVFFGERVVDLIRSVYPHARIIIKPHPAIVQHEHTFVIDKAIFANLMSKWREQCQQDPLVELVDNPEASIADSFARADILLADASSLIYEFMTLDRPVILYSAEKRVSHWEYNPNAPGNAWRDIGLEFNDDETFISHLRNVFQHHKQYCSKAQANRTAFLHGIFQDGRSTNRVATTIIDHPPLDVVIYGENTASSDKTLLAAQIDNWLAFSRITVISDDSKGDNIYKSLNDWQQTLEEKPYRHHAVLFIDADKGLIPTSAHQITRGLQELARGNFKRLVMRSADQPALVLMSAHDAVTFDPLKLNAADSHESRWRDDKFNATPLDGLVRKPGQPWFKVSDDAHLLLTPAIIGTTPKETSLKLNITAIPPEGYDQFPFSIKVVVNGNIVKEELIESTHERVLDIPFIANQEGLCDVRIISSASVRTPNDFIDNIAFFMQSAQLSLLEPVVHSSGMNEWLAARTPSAAQIRFIDEHEQLHPQLTSLNCLILVNNLQDNLHSTLNNLAKLNQQMGSLTLKPVIFNLTGETLPAVADHNIYTVDKTELAASINQWVLGNEHDWFVLLNAGERLTRNGTLVARLQLPMAQACAAVYSDAVLAEGDEINSLAFLPDFNLDLLLSMPGIMAQNWLFNRNTFIELGGFSQEWPDAMQFEYITRIIEQKGIAVIGHLDEPFVVRLPYTLNHCEQQKMILEKHLYNRGYENATVNAQYPGVWRLKYNVPSEPLVSIIIPTKDQLPVLITCIITLLEKTTYSNYEILIVDNNSESDETKQWLENIAQVDPDRLRVLPYPLPFNYSAINNMAVREARGEYLVLLNNDTAIIQPDWLENMLNHAQRPEVGIVGAKLLYPDGSIQHAGVVLGLRGPADHPFIGRSGDETGYLNRLIADQNYTAVTAACMMVRKEVYEAAGGLDEEQFRVSYNDVDFCLKVRELGFMTVWTPYAMLMHEGNLSQNKVDTATAEAKRKRFEDEQDEMYRKWLPLIAKDPSYNSNLTLSGEGFALSDDSKHTWRPVYWDPVPTVMAHMADLAGSGHYRIIHPFEAMENAGLVQGTLSAQLMSIPQFAQFKTDSIVFQRLMTPEDQQWLARISKFSHAFKVMELDDYLPALAQQRGGQSNISVEMLSSIQKSLSMVDRFVVATPMLAERFANAHTDIRIAETRLPVGEWGHLAPLRAQGRKPRIGWAGGVNDMLDLEIISDVVRALADKVEWVFVGMCPAHLRPYVYEFHVDMNVHNYPAKLASLNLDLALIPLADNLFNRCKSHVQLLEFGACGYPVIASDLECYRNNLPVTLVRNRSQAWKEAIETHLSDREASWRSGDALREAVLRDWMLTGEPLKKWAKIWLPD